MRSQIRTCHPFILGLVATLAVVWLIAVWGPVSLHASSEEWQRRVRELVRQEAIREALEIAEDRLSAHPKDLEARGWRARLLAWTHRWNESEIEYRVVLQFAPHDVDILVGLADLLTWQGRRVEAIVFLDQANLLEANRNDIQLRRGRVLHALGRRAEAGTAYADVLSLRSLSIRLNGVVPDVQSNDAVFGADRLVMLDPAEAQSLEAATQWRLSLVSTSEVRLRPVRGFRIGPRITTRVDFSGSRSRTSNGMNYAVRF